MYVKFLCNWPPYRDGQCLELTDRFGSHFVARGMAQVVTAEVEAYAATMSAVDSAIERRTGAMPAKAGRREVTEDEWRAELGQDRSGYQQARLAYIARRVNVAERLPAAITTRS
jgi:hypothetical protein